MFRGFESVRAEMMEKHQVWARGEEALKSNTKQKMRPTTTIVQAHRWEPPAGVPPGGLPPGMPASAPAAAQGEYVDGGWIPCRQDPLPEATCGCVRNPSLQAESSGGDKENAPEAEAAHVPRWKRPKGRAKRGALGVVNGNREWILPVKGTSVISSPFGPRSDPCMDVGGEVKFHNGLDLAAETGTAVVAAQSGTVAFAGQRGALGATVELVHDDGLVSKYAHNSRLFTEVGKRVKQGERIAAVGESGRATGPHLHFEIRRQGVSQDPLPSLEKVCTRSGMELTSNLPQPDERPWRSAAGLSIITTGVISVLDFHRQLTSRGGNLQQPQSRMMA